MNQQNHHKSKLGKWWLLCLFLLIFYLASKFQQNDQIDQSPATSVSVNAEESTADNSSILATTQEVITDDWEVENGIGINGDDDFLREVRSQEFVSPAGLRYTRGSEEGHRLYHLARHLEDQPDRPGKHGVFTADMRQVLLWLDEAYTRSKAKARGTSVRQEDNRTIIETSFDRHLGYIGGREGGRINNPKTKRLRLILDNDRVITAFPF